MDLLHEGFEFLPNNKHGELFYQYRSGKYGFSILYVNDTVLWQPLTYSGDITLHYDDSNDTLTLGIKTIGESLIPYLGTATIDEVINLKHRLLNMFNTGEN